MPTNELIGILITRLDALFGHTLISAGGNIAIGALFIEGAALGGAKLLADKKGLIARATKVALTTTAALAAFLLSSGVCFAVTVGMSFYYPANLNILFAIGIVTGALTAPVHYKAFKWARVV